MRILVAEDHGPSRRLVEATLRVLGHEVVAVESGSAAWDAFQRDPFPILVSDWVMPDGDGLELCRRVRESEPARHAYVIVVTGRDSRDDRRTALASGADDFLTKPYEPTVLEARVRVAARIVALQERLRQLGAGAVGPPRPPRRREVLDGH